MRTIIQTASAISLAVLVGCGSTKPKSAEDRAEIEAEAMETITQMDARAPGLRATLRDADGYAVFPAVGKGGLVVGGAHGRGVLYERGEPVGYVQLTEASIGLQAGGESFAEIIVFHDRESLEEVKHDEFELGAGASVIALDEGAAAAAQPLEEGVAVYLMPRGGLMADVSVSGQRIDFEPRG